MPIHGTSAKLQNQTINNIKESLGINSKPRINSKLIPKDPKCTPARFRLNVKHFFLELIRGLELIPKDPLIERFWSGPADSSESMEASAPNRWKKTPQPQLEPVYKQKVTLTEFY